MPGAPQMLAMPRDQVRRLQQILKAQGLYRGRVTGNWDTRTQLALRGFQRRNNLPVSGVYDAATQGLLRDTFARLANGSVQNVPGLNDQTREFIAENYGSFSMYLRIPEMRDLIIRAAREEWDEYRVQEELQQTTWWRNHSSSERSWYELRFTDPAAARRRRTQVESTVRDEMFRMGVELRPQHLARIVEEAIINDWGSNEITDALAAQSRFHGGDIATGSILTDMRRIAQIRSSYMLPANDRGNHRIARRIAAGEMTIEDLEAEFAARAAQRYPWLADQINAGTSVRDLFDSQVQAVADTLELDPDSIDLADPQWSEITSFVDENGNTRGMTIGEARLMARKRPGFRRTESARREGASLAMTIGQTFGSF